MVFWIEERGIVGVFFLAVVCDFDGSVSYILFLWVAFVAFVMEWERVSLLSATEFRNLRACFCGPYEERMVKGS